MDDANRRARRARGLAKQQAIQEASEYRSMFKAFMHNQTTLEYAKHEAPLILSTLCAYIREHGLMTDAEITAVYDKGKERAQARARMAEKEMERVYGTFQTFSSRPYADPTADAAIARVDREMKKHGGDSR